MTKPVVIIGAGPAGLSCAYQLAKGGREVVLIDDNLQPGGQYFRQLPPTYSTSAKNRLLRDQARFDKLAQVLTMPGVRHLTSTVAWAAPKSLTIAFAGPEASGRIDASEVVIASGAQDRPFPFSGWTLPGVISAGGCLNLAKAHGLVPTGNILIAGNGPLVLVAAATMIAAGAKVLGVVEAQSSSRLIPAVLDGVISAPRVLFTAAGYRRRILQSGAWFRTGWMLAEAEGEDAVRRVAIAPVGSGGRPDRARQEWHDVDTLVVGYGLVPSAEFARAAGCRMEFRPELNGMVPVRSPQLETSLPGVYAIGDGAGIGGVEVALLEGKIAASAILGGQPDRPLVRRYSRLDRFRRRLNLAYAPLVPLVAARDDTIICRCEEIRLGDLVADPNFTSGSLNSLKTSSRLGMGRCQGRNCLPTAIDVLGLPAEARSTYPRARPPLRPVRLHHLIADADVGPAREPDEINIAKNGDNR